MKVYNKLVRDKIPQVIEKSGSHYDVHIAEKAELVGLLETKMEEEFAEYKEARNLEGQNLEELADMMEVVFGLAKALGYSEEELMKVREEKREKRGGFEEGIVLERVWE